MGKAAEDDKDNKSDPFAQKPQKLLGGFQTFRDCKDEEKKMVTDLRAKIEKKAGETFKTFEPMGIMEQDPTQAEDGTQLWFSIMTNEGLIHAKILKPKEGEPTIQDFRSNLDFSFFNIGDSLTKAPG